MCLWVGLPRIAATLRHRVPGSARRTCAGRPCAPNGGIVPRFESANLVRVGREPGLDVRRAAAVEIREAANTVPSRAAHPVGASLGAREVVRRGVALLSAFQLGGNDSRADQASLHLGRPNAVHDARVHDVARTAVPVCTRRVRRYLMRSHWPTARDEPAVPTTPAASSQPQLPSFDRGGSIGWSCAGVASTSSSGTREDVASLGRCARSRSAANRRRGSPSVSAHPTPTRRTIGPAAGDPTRFPS